MNQINTFHHQERTLKREADEESKSSVEDEKQPRKAAVKEEKNYSKAATKGQKLHSKAVSLVIGRMEKYF